MKKGILPNLPEKDCAVLIKFTNGAICSGRFWAKRPNIYGPRGSMSCLLEPRFTEDFGERDIGTYEMKDISAWIVIESELFDE